MKKTAFYTLGCRANQAQTEVLRSLLPEEGDICVINTCMVTHDAERKSRQAIRRMIRENPTAKIIITGCLAKLKVKELKKLFPQAEIVNSPSLITSHIPHISRVRMNLMIQDGCEHFCSYCIVPYTRGKVQSKPLAQVEKEAKQLVGAGAGEIILTGINLATYQYDLKEVIKRLSPIENLFRIRFSSLEPMYLDRKLIDAIAENPKVCRFLHIPLQSGDNNILKSMKRNYKREDYIDLIKYIRRKIPECGISTDIIVGFPGEGEKEFQNSIDLVNDLKFSRIHIFPYSIRKGTPAAEMPDQVNERTKAERNKNLHKLRDKYMKEFAKQYLNKEVEILVERKGEGLTSNFIRCYFDDPTNSTGKLRSIIYPG
ncbi:MAG: MiaB/RimO family radical SAM methylthiotransferase [Candidatus Margulisiibacteriota bacterium]|nr:MiaB/RimO family radical SAM methylthiotransferase [Candidatus Margulisiibacteriota bacterium]